MALAVARQRKHQIAAWRSPLGGRRLEASTAGPILLIAENLGTKRHIFSDGRGVPIAAEVSAANAHDKMMAIEVTDSIVVERPRPTESDQQHICMDKGYDYDDIREAMADRGYIAHIRRRGEGPPPPKSERHPHGAGSSRGSTSGTIAFASC